jgi:hypothetical protein
MRCSSHRAGQACAFFLPKRLKTLCLEPCELRPHAIAARAPGRMQDNEPLMRALSSLIALNEPDLVLFVGEALVGNDAVDQLTKFNRRLTDLARNQARPPRGAREALRVCPGSVQGLRVVPASRPCCLDAQPLPRPAGCTACLCFGEAAVPRSLPETKAGRYRRCTACAAARRAASRSVRMIGGERTTCSAGQALC